MHLKSHFLIMQKVLVVQKRINYGKPYIIKKTDNFAREKGFVVKLDASIWSKNQNT